MNRRHLLGLALALALAGGTNLAGTAAGAEAARLRLPNGPPRKPARPRVVVIDPGHGGRDPGAIGARGTVEKLVTLDIAATMVRHLGEHPGIRALATRTGDDYVPLADRVAFAQSVGADLMLSIHADSAPNTEARGLSAYVLSATASDSLAHAIAEQENLVDQRHGGALGGADAEVKAILYDLAVRHTMNAALRVRHDLVRGAGAELRLLDNPMRAANFAVLKAPDVPSVLVETGFLSNRKDEDLLADPKGRRRIAAVLAREVARAVVGTQA